VGHKVHPIGFRLGVIFTWDAKWYADRHYADLLHEDLKIRGFIAESLRDASVSKVEIDRNANIVLVTVHTARPGIVIGRGGQKVDELRQRLETLSGRRVRVNIVEIRQPELDSTLVARSVAEQLERRVSHRRAMKQAVTRTMQRGAEGIKIIVGGRLGGAEMSRRETEKSGRVPLHTLRANIDYGTAEAHTTFGRIGVKVWIYKGEILPEPKAIPQPVEETPPVEEPPAEAQEAPVVVEASTAAAEESPAEAEGAPPEPAEETEEAVAPVASVMAEETASE
jgi:small subunit ribosomal protein S3